MYLPIIFQYRVEQASNGKFDAYNIGHYIKWNMYLSKISVNFWDEPSKLKSHVTGVLHIVTFSGDGDSLELKV